MLQEPLFAVFNMEDGLIDVIVMNLILKKAQCDAQSRRRQEHRNLYSFGFASKSLQLNGYWESALVNELD